MTTLQTLRLSLRVGILVPQDAFVYQLRMVTMLPVCESCTFLEFYVQMLKRRHLGKK